MKHGISNVPKLGIPKLPKFERPDAPGHKKFWVEPVPGMRKACERDMEAFCPEQHGAAAVPCLKAHKAELSPPCAKRLFAVQEMQAGDMTLDIPLFEACKADLEDISVCGRAPPAVRKRCLMAPKQRDRLSEKCRAALFKNEAEESEDVRLRTDVLEVCRLAISAECDGIPFGEARMLMCLWENVVAARQESGWGAYEECAAKVTDLVGRQVSHYQLDFRVRTKCADDIGRLCAAEKELVDKLPISQLFGAEGQQGGAGQVLRCLKENLQDLQVPCQGEMTRVARIQSLHADLDPEIQRECKSEVAEFCGDQPREQVHLCLRRHFQSLGAECRKAEGLQARLEMETSIMRPRTRVICKRASDQFCGEVGPKEVRRCLEDSMDKEAFPVACKEALTEDMEASNHDWQLKFGISSECQEDVRVHCKEESGTPGTGVLSCLSKKHASNELVQSGCQEEVTRYLKAGAQNIKVLPDAFEACKEDVASYCAAVPTGQGRVHACLMKHRSSLSPRCAAAEFENQEVQAKDVRMSPEAMKYCGPVMAKLCPGVEPGEGRMWACLIEHRSSPDMPERCAQAVKRHAELRQSEFLLNPGLFAKCKGEAKRLCPEEYSKASRRNFGAHGKVISCLISKREEVQDAACQAAIHSKQSERVQMASMDPDHDEVCAADIDRHCQRAKRAADLSRGTEGLVHTCLQKHLPELSEACAKKEREYMVMASEEARLNIPVAQSCKQAARRWCDGVPDKDGLLQACLLKHLHDESMEVSCRQALVPEMTKRATSLRFNPQLRKACAAELRRLGQEGRCLLPNGNGIRKPGAMVDCLTDHVDDIQDPACKDATLQVMQTHSADLRAKPGMHDACRQDLQALCPDVALGAGRGHECLRAKIDQIRSDECREKVKAVLEADNAKATLNFGIRTHCTNEIGMFCPLTRYGEVMVCLQIHANETGFSRECSTALSKVPVNSTAVKRMRGSLSGITQPLDKSIEELRSWLRNHRGFAEEHGVILLSGTVGFVAVLTAWISWCLLRRLWSGKSGYTVVVPKDLSS